MHGFDCKESWEHISCVFVHMQTISNGIKKKKIINRKIRLIKSLLLIDKNKTIFDIKKKEL
jgi:hypothetical protein